MIYSLKLECEKLAGEKIEIQRHYVMVRFYLFFSFNCFISVSPIQRFRMWTKPERECVYVVISFGVHKTTTPTLKIEDTFPFIASFKFTFITFTETHSRQ